MLELITVMPDEGVDHKRGQKHPFVVNELFGCECQQLINMFFQYEILLEKLFAYLDRDESVSILDGYFSKAAGLVLNKNPTGTLEFLSRKGYLRRLPKRLFSRSISEFILKLLVTEMNLPDQSLKKDLLSEIVSLLSSENEISSTYASLLLTDLISKLGEGPQVKDLIVTIASGNNLKSLLESAQTNSMHSIANSLEVIKNLLTSPIREELLGPTKSSEEDSTIIDEEDPSEFSKALISSFQFLSERLSRQSEVNLTTQKQQIEVLGIDRLKICELFVTCVRLERKDVLSALRNCQVFERLTKLFFNFEMNSFLHNLYENFVSAIFDQLANEDDALKDLITKSDLLNMLSLKCDNRGFSGQVVKIGTSLLKIKVRNPEFSKLLDDSVEWKKFYDDFYAKKTEVEKKTLGETNSKVSDDLSSDDSGHQNETKDAMDMLFGSRKTKKDEDEDDNEFDRDDSDNKKDDFENFEKDENEVDSEPMDMGELEGEKEKSKQEKVKTSGGKSKKSKKRYNDDEYDSYGSEQKQEEISDEDYWRF